MNDKRSLVGALKTQGRGDNRLAGCGFPMGENTEKFLPLIQVGKPADVFQFIVGKQSGSFVIGLERCEQGLVDLLGKFPFVLGRHGPGGIDQKNDIVDHPYHNYL